MKISVDWIKDFVELPNNISVDEVGKKFTLATAEIEDIEEVNGHLEKIVVAKILEIEQHPDADKLNLVTFTTGIDDEMQVVCGAPNVKVGMKVPYAPLGTTFPGGFTLEPKKIRGVLSEGMLCSESELGLSENAKGLMELPADCELGLSMMNYLDEKRDIVIEVDNKSLTHRPDLWGNFGIAREFSTVFSKDLKNRFTNDWMKNFEKLYTKDQSPVVPTIEGECSCKGYFGLSVNGIKIEESPKWMQRRLKTVGLRPINNIVDISNYVMIELGIPLHIFDRDQIKGDKLIIKKLGKSELFKTLDEVERELISEDTIIADSESPLVLAGIMGGLSSGVNEKTKDIFIEVANWKPVDVRRTSMRLGLRTDSSQRYEKSLDNQLLKRTVFRTLELVLELCPDAKVIGKLEYVGEDLSNYKPLVIESSVSKINKVLGHNIDEKRILDIFDSLGFNVKNNKGQLNVEVPSYRSTKDVEVEADLIEEIGRIVGYDNIEPISPEFKVAPVSYTAIQKLHYSIRNFLVNSSRSFEIVTYPMVGEKLLKKAGFEVKGVTLLNALSKESEMMRDSIIPSLLEASSLNQKNYQDFRLFEIGRCYLPNPKKFVEEHSTVGIVFYSKDQNVFMELVNETEKLLNSINVPYKLCEKNELFSNPLVSSNWKGLHPYEYFDIKVMGKNVGLVQTVHPIVLKEFKLKGNLSMMVLDLNSFEEREMKNKFKYEPIAKFPSATFDCTVVCNKSDSVDNILKVIQKIKQKEIVAYKIVEVFTLSESQNSVTIRSSFLDKEKTLKPELIKDIENQIVRKLDQSGYPLKNI